MGHSPPSLRSRDWEEIAAVNRLIGYSGVLAVGGTDSLISRKGWGLSRPNLNLDRADSWRTRGLRRLEVKPQCFL